MDDIIVWPLGLLTFLALARFGVHSTEPRVFLSYVYYKGLLDSCQVLSANLLLTIIYCKYILSLGGAKIWINMMFAQCGRSET